MTIGTLIELQANLKALNLTSMARNLEGSLRQARESGIGYDEFLVELTAAELQARAENSLNRRIKEAKFPLLKPMETFDLAAVPELDLRLFGILREAVISGNTGTSFFLDTAAPARPIWPSPWGSRHVRITFGPGLSPATVWSMN